MFTGFALKRFLWQRRIKHQRSRQASEWNDIEGLTSQQVTAVIFLCVAWSALLAIMAIGGCLGWDL